MKRLGVFCVLSLSHHYARCKRSTLVNPALRAEQTSLIFGGHYSTTERLALDKPMPRSRIFLAKSFYALYRLLLIDASDSLSPTSLGPLLPSSSLPNPSFSSLRVRRLIYTAYPSTAP
ncbi:hypothetical protein BJ912DRAFT_998878 [Pholiota molesta]|nr:hypothetical protein BJ912DRAFT_998878 [Pholiota molesta]